MSTSKIDPQLIATTCSPRHIQSVLEDLQAKLLVAEQLARAVDSLNPFCLEIGAGRLAQMQHLARDVLKGG